MGNVFYFEWELALIEFLQRIIPDWFINILKLVTEFGDQTAMILVIGFFYWCYDIKVGRKMFFSLSLVAVGFPYIKNIFFRIRPYIVSKNIKCLKAVDSNYDIYDTAHQGYSFPSGHCADCTSVYGKLFKDYKNTIFRIVLLTITLLVGLSRMALGVHYPTDVLAGYLLGLLAMTLVDFLDDKVNPKIYYPIILILAASGFLFCTSSDFYAGYGILFGFAIGDLFRDKYVEYKTSTNIIETIVRLVLGVALFLGLDVVMKLPFSAEFLNQKELLPFLVRTIRYAILVFIEVGIYPLTFKYMKFSKGDKK